MDKEYVLSLSYGKDSIACLEAIKILGYPLDRIVHAEVWATDAISADLPPMVEFKAKADKIIKERYGIEVEHICAMKDGRRMTYERGFYHIPQPRKNTQKIGGGVPRVRYKATKLVQHASQTSRAGKDSPREPPRGVRI